MIFGHLGIAFLLKSKFYKRSLILLVILCYIPDILYYFITWILQYVTLPTYEYGLAHWILALFGAESSWAKNLIPLSHSFILYLIFTAFLLAYLLFHSRIKAGLIYTFAFLSHLVVDIFLLDHYWGVYLFFPFDSDPTHSLPFFVYTDSTIFWLVDLALFIAGFFAILWAFSKYEGREELPL